MSELIDLIEKLNNNMDCLQERQNSDRNAMLKAFTEVNEVFKTLHEQIAHMSFTMSYLVTPKDKIKYDG